MESDYHGFNVNNYVKDTIAVIICVVLFSITYYLPQQLPAKLSQYTIFGWLASLAPYASYFLILALAGDLSIFFSRKTIRTTKEALGSGALIGAIVSLFIFIFLIHVIAPIYEYPSNMYFINMDFSLLWISEALIFLAIGAFTGALGAFKYAVVDLEYPDEGNIFINDRKVPLSPIILVAVVIALNTITLLPAVL